MRLSLDPELKAMAKNLDYRGFLREMRARGLATAGRNSAYRRQVQEFLRQDQAAFKQAFQSVLAAMPHLEEGIERDDRFNALVATLHSGAPNQTAPSSLLSTGEPPEMQSGVALAAVVVVIAAAVVAYVSVAVGVTVGVVAGFSISVGVSVAVAASGGCRINCPIPAAHERETRRAAAVAKMLGRPDLAAQVIRADIDSQLAAITQAAIDLQLLKVPADRRARFDRQLRQLAYDAAGVPVQAT
jgi:hypothetical protein